MGYEVEEKQRKKKRMMTGDRHPQGMKKVGRTSGGVKRARCWCNLFGIFRLPAVLWFFFFFFFFCPRRSLQTPRERECVCATDGIFSHRPSNPVVNSENENAYTRWWGMQCSKKVSACGACPRCATPKDGNRPSFPLLAAPFHLEGAL